MKLLNPNEIGTKISTLLVEAKETFISVSPYLDISSWKKMIKSLEQSSSKVDIFFYYREIKDIDKQLLERLNVKLIHIPNLHAKMYFNEKECIVSSMNLYEYSDLNSIEIATQYTDKKDYNLLFSYFNKYIKTSKSNLSLSFTSKASKVTTSYKGDNNDRDFIKEENGHKIYKWNCHKYKDEFLEFERTLHREWGDVRCSYSDNYMFVKRIIDSFELFVYENENLHLKYYKRTDKINIEDWNNIEAYLTKELKQIKHTFKRGSESEGEYGYHIWKFENAKDLFQSLPIFKKSINLK